MSHLIEEYAKSCGVKIGKPKVQEAFFPILFDNYLTIQTTKKFASRNYSYWSDVVYILKNTDPEIKLVQVGSTEDPRIEGVDQSLLGVTSLQQLLYIIKRSAGHVGIDSLGVHAASMYDKPIVGLYSNMRPENSGPYWNINNDAICITPDFNKKKPSYATDEDPKTIDTIPPEEIAKAVLKISKSEKTIESYKSIYLGNDYSIGIIEVCPNFINNGLIPDNQPVNLRLDWHLDLNIAGNWASTRKVNVFMDKEVELNFFKHLKPNMNQVNYFIDENTNPEYISNLYATGVKVSLYTKNKNNIEQLRLKFIDWIVNEYKTRSKKDLDNIQEICNNTVYKSSKSILSNGQIYHSKAAMTLNFPRNGNPQKIIDNDEFWAELDNMYIFNE